MSCIEMINIIPFLVLTFWQQVYLLLYEKDQHFSRKSKEVCLHFVGISKHIGHVMTFLILLNDLQEAVLCSLVCSTLDSNSFNFCLEHNNTSAIHLTIQAEIICGVKLKQHDCVLGNIKQQQKQLLLDCIHICLDQDLNQNESNDENFLAVLIPFIHLSDNGEFNPSIHLDKPS